MFILFFFSSRRRHTRWPRDWSSDVCSSDLSAPRAQARQPHPHPPAGLVEPDDLHLFVVTAVFLHHGVHRSEEHTSELQSRGHLVCRLLLEKKRDATGGSPGWES